MEQVMEALDASWGTDHREHGNDGAAVHDGDKKVVEQESSYENSC